MSRGLLLFGLSLWLASVNGERFVVEIVSPLLYADTMSGAGYVGPPLQLAVDEINSLFNATIYFKLTILDSPYFTGCVPMMDNVEEQIAKYFFRRKTQPNATVLIAGGCMDAVQMGRIASGLKMLSLLTVGSDIQLYNRRLFSHVIMSSPFIITFLQRAAVSFLQLNHWRTLYVVFESTGVASAAAIQGKNALLALLARDPAINAYSLGLPSKASLTEPLLDIRTRARIVVIIGHSDFLRRIMLAAHRANMTSGDFVFIALSPLEYYSSLFGSYSWQYSDQDDEEAKEAFRSLFLLAPPQTLDSFPQIDLFLSIMRTEAKTRFRLDHGCFGSNCSKPSPTSISTYMTVHAFAQVINATLRTVPDWDWSDTAALSRYFLGHSFQTPAGELSFDALGQRRFWIEIRETNSSGALETVMVQSPFTYKLGKAAEIKWIGGEWPVRDVPLCDFDGNGGPCRQEAQLLIGVASGVAVALVLGILLICQVARRMSAKHSGAVFVWNLPGSLVFQTLRGASRVTLAFGGSDDLTKVQTASFEEGKPALYEGQRVSIRHVNVARRSFDPKKKFFETIKILNHLRQQQHINRFVGIKVSPDRTSVFLVSDYCSRGDIEHFFHMTDNIDFDIVLSFMGDLFKGLLEIHRSKLRFSDGLINPQRCVLDSRLTLKLSDVGYNTLLKTGYNIAYSYTDAECERDVQIYVAPEAKESGFRGSQAADVFAAGVICGQMINRFECLHPQDMQRKECPMSLWDALLDTMNEGESARPPTWKLAKLFAADESHFVEKIFRRMEEYAESLEAAVALRTNELGDEQARTDRLLQEMLPKDVVQDLRKGLPVAAEDFVSVSIMFTNLVGFAEFVASKSPFETFDILNSLYGLFDGVIAEHHVYKVETIGASYLIAAGLPEKCQPTQHAANIGYCAISLRKAFLSGYIEDNPCVRFGIHAGSCVAAVVGLQRPRYCLFGDTINTASRMESHGEPLAIHISSPIKALLDDAGSFHCSLRGVINVKGKGDMETWWLLDQ